MSLVKWNGLTRQLNRLRKWLLYGPRSDTLAYVRRLNARGARIDESLNMPTPESVCLDDTNPYMLEIGKNVSIAAGVKILTHDAANLALKGRDGRIRGHIAPVKIGDNVFIGMDSIILCGVTICNDVIIGAGSVVSVSIRKPGVYTGSPARLAVPYEDYRELREAHQLREAYTMAAQYYRRFGKKPPQENFYEYFWLFAPRQIDMLPEPFLQQMRESGNFAYTVEKFMESEPEFDGYDAFWSWCLSKLERG